MLRSLTFLIVAGTLTPTLAAQTRYVVTDLGGVGVPAAYTSAIAINNAGQVVGNSSRADFSAYLAYRTAPNATINSATDLIPPLPGGTYSQVNLNAINNSGQVAGNSNPGGRSEGFRLDADSTIHDLGNLGGSIPSSFAWGINDLGEVTGASNVPNTAFCFFSFGSQAFRTAANNALTATGGLGTLINNCRSSLGTGINNTSQVVGWSDFGNFNNPEQHAMLVTGSVMQDLGILGGAATFPAVMGKNAVANAINNAGQIVGTSTYNGAPFPYVTHAFVTTPDGPMKDLGTIGGAWSSANGINTAGQIVGNSTTAGDAAGHAFLYTGGVMSDLNSMIAPGSGWEIVNATAINDTGQIVATGWLNGVKFVNHPLRLDPADVAVTNLGTQVFNLAVPLGTKIRFLVRLIQAFFAIRNNDFSRAIRDLNAFINDVNAQSSRQLNAATAAALVATANAINASI